MSLTDRLRDSGSPVRAFIEGISPHLASLSGPTSSARTTAASLGLVNLAKSPVLVHAPQSGESALIGTAFDIRARISLGRFDARMSASHTGVSKLLSLADDIENGRHRASVLSELFILAEELLLDTEDETKLDLAAVLFAYCEQNHRGGANALQGILGKACDQASDAYEFVNNLDSDVLANMRALMDSGTPQIEKWKSQIVGGERFEPNPDFAGSLLVDGADGDWLIGETLIDCKVYGQLSIHKLRNFLLQLLGYVMLDLDDALKIRHVGLWLPRQQMMKSWSLEHLLAEDPEVALPRLRNEFIKATNPNQVALHIPVTQRRKHQLLADNRHTPAEMLTALANSDDNDIRFRVGRNERTPESTVRLLAADHYARAREGAAMNERIPADVLDRLSRDSSVVVRRAAGLNRSLSGQRSNALGSGDRGIDSDASAVAEIQIVGGIEHDTFSDVIEINQKRADWSLHTGWLTSFLSWVLQTDSGYQTRVLIPEASRIWSYISGAPFSFPEGLKAGLSDAVIENLFRDDRPVSVRRVIARILPVSDAVVRNRLLNDLDAEIRWWTLQHSKEQADETLSELLGKLASSREARLHFRKDDGKSSYWAPTPAELDQQVLQLLGEHPATPPHVLRELMKNKRPELLIALASNPTLGSEDREGLVHAMIASRSRDARELFASSKHTPPAVLRSLASSRTTDIREIVAENTHVPFETLAMLATDPSQTVRLAVLRNRETPGDLAASISQDLLRNSADHELLEVLDVLDQRIDVELPESLVEDALDRLSKSRVRDPDMRYEVGSDTRTNERTLKRLSRSADDEVRQAVAGNSSSTDSVLELLKVDLVTDVRAAVAGNKATAAATLIELSQDDAAVVRLAAAKNSKLSQEALRMLITDGDPRVSNFVSGNPSANSQDTTQGELERHEQPKEPRAMRADLEDMAADSRAETRIQVAYEKSAPPDILKFLGGEKGSKKVRRAVAAHSNTPAEVLWSLSTDKDFEVHQVVALNSSAPAELLMELAGRSVDFALLVSLNPGVPDEVLDALAADEEVLVSFVANVTKAQRSMTVGSEIHQLSTAAGNTD